MTQRQLAQEVGVTRQTIITIEANRYSPSLKLAFRIARAFGVSVEDVFQYSRSRSSAEMRSVAASSSALVEMCRAVRARAPQTRIVLGGFGAVGLEATRSPDELAALCRERGAALVFDAGSGSLYNFSRFGLAGESTLAEIVSAGGDVVTCSADKLLGGPQAGILVGRAELVARARAHPLFRTLRVDKRLWCCAELGGAPSIHWALRSGSRTGAELAAERPIRGRFDDAPMMHNRGLAMNPSKRLRGRKVNREMGFEAQGNSM